MNRTQVVSITFAALTFAGAVSAADLNTASESNTTSDLLPSWAGLYAGLGVGLRAAHSDVNSTSLVLGGVVRDVTAFAGPQGQQLDGTAFLASPYVGFNWQVAPKWVAGIESSFGFGSQKTALAGLISSPAFGSSGNAADSLAVKTAWNASLRGRLGYLIAPTTLAYLTGGVAWQHYEVISTCVSLICQVIPGSNGFTPAIVTNSITKMGWTIGGGFEVELWQQWLARAEYRYADFGTPSFTINRSSIRPAFNPVMDTFEVELRTHTVTFGLAYKFN